MVPESDDFASELRSDCRPGRSMIRRDPWAIAVAGLSILTQFGMWIWWGGRLDQRVESHDQRIASVESKSQQREEAKTIIDSTQTTQIAVITSKLEDIKQSVERIDRKIPERAR